MTASEVVAFYKAMASLGVTVWLDGGWGVDALIGRQTRVHKDLDIVVQESDLDRVVTFLAAQGFRRLARADDRAWNFVMGNGDGRMVDFHVVVLDAEGNGLYGPPERGEGMYPAAALQGRGSIDGLPVRCTSAEFQLESHSGYVLKATDHADMRALAQHFGLELPPEYGGPSVKG